MEYGNFIIVYLKAWVTHHNLVMVQWVYQVLSMCHFISKLSIIVVSKTPAERTFLCFFSWSSLTDIIHVCHLS